MLLAPKPGGSGRFVVVNRGPRDTVVTLASGGKAVVVLYVRARSTTKIDGVRDGTLSVYTVSGSSWGGRKDMFDTVTDARELDRSARFTSTATSSTEITLTLETENGNATAKPVPPSTVPW
ncbi:hypothetical protein [Pseudonocardia phyllosphaerae]|uniref:hypothetical protein n=1 Tax=Pseudonocardia phyllosphaerae TaxID=3390502 RepID=UPI00397BEB14